MSKHVALAICLQDTHKHPTEQKILLVCEKLSNRLDVKDGYKWGLPGGKCCDNKHKNVNCCAETPKETVVREFKEETGYDAEILKLLFKIEKVNPESMEKFAQYVYMLKIVSGVPTHNQMNGTVLSPRWFALGAFPRNSYKSHQEIITRYFVEYKGLRA